MSEPLADAIAGRLRAWETERVAERLWAKDGTLIPAFTLPNGHHRWNLADVQRQLREQRGRSE